MFTLRSLSNHQTDVIPPSPVQIYNQSMPINGMPEKTAIPLARSLLKMTGKISLM